LYAKQRHQQERAVTSTICQRYWGGRLLGDLMWIGVLIAAPQDTADGRLANRKGPRQNHAMLVARLVAGRIDSALMQCSLGSRSGTSGDDVCGASRSWTGDAIPLAWRVQGAATGVCRPHHTGHQSFFASQLEERPRPHRLAWLRNPSSVSFLRSNWLPHLGNRLIISNMTKSNAPKKQSQGG
jgi:hypothetical protein